MPETAQLGPYLSKNINIFEDAEPYFYGEGAPYDGYFLPIGEDNDDKTEDIKVQAAEDNGYSELGTVSGFRINGHPLKYIKKGTFPIISEKQLLWEWHPQSIVSQKTRHLYVEYGEDTTKIKSIRGGTGWVTTQFPADKLKWDFTLTTDPAKSNGYELFKEEIVSTHNLSELPHRLGFVLVGSGGGAGGITQYDVDKNGKTSDQYACAGSGGGGGETVWGVLDLTCPAVIPVITETGAEHCKILEQEIETAKDNIKIKALDFLIQIGVAGTGGASGDWDDTSHKKPQFGQNGTSGGYSYIQVNAAYTDSASATPDELLWVYPKDRNQTCTIVTAQGGKGGVYGIYNTQCAGGEGGGTTSITHETSTQCVICGRQKGGNGGTVSGTGTITTPGLNFNIYASNTSPTNLQHYIRIQHEAAEGTQGTAGGKENENTNSVNVPGGHSFGNGASKALPSTAGGGGACCNHDSNNDGAYGLFALYY